MSSHSNIYLNGVGQKGSVSFSSNSVEFKDHEGRVQRSVPRDQLLKAFTAQYGKKGQLEIVTKEGKSVFFSGFEDMNVVKKQVESVYGIACEKHEAACDGGNFGDVVLNESSLQMNSAKTGKPAFELKLHNVSQCVLPGNMKDEVEIQFFDNDADNKEEDCLVQIRMRFPGAESDDEETPAETFQKRIMERGMIHSVTGDVIAEFTEDQGTFIAPRGRYAIQMYSTFLRMHGAKYDYKITYEDIGTIYLLYKPDGVSAALVISLQKHIRQGNQKYPYLVLQCNRLESTIKINLPEDEIAEKYDGKLAPEMTMAMASLIATIFKVLAQSRVLVTRNFKSDQEHDCIKCAHKQNDGLLFPFEKSIIFIHKPTIIIRYSDVEAVEYGRYKTDKHAATKNFDLKLFIKPGLQSAYGDVKEFEFKGIERQEFSNLHAFLQSKKMNVQDVEVAQKTLLEELDEGLPEDSEEDDGDYNSDNASSSSSGGSESEGYASDSGGESKKRKSKVLKKRKDKPSKKGKSSKEEDTPKKKKKDKNAPKGALSAYVLFGNEMRADIKEKNPDITPTEVMKEIGVRWKAMSAEDKKPFEEKSKVDKGRYKDEMAEYKAKRVAAGEESEKEAPKKKKAKKDKDAPKGPSSAYIIFGNETRNAVKEENPGISATDILKEIGSRWRAMSAEDKIPFDKKAAEDKLRYKKEMGEYKEKKAAEGNDSGSGGGSESDDGNSSSDDSNDSDGGSMSEDESN